MQTISDTSAFLSAALRQPGVIGAVAPSGPALAEVLAAVVPGRDKPVVAELGPGTGPVSRVIGRRLPPGGRHFAVEIDPELADRLELTHPDVEVLRGDAADLGALLYGAGVRQVDAVVSGLPWSLFPEAQQRAILEQVCYVLAPGAGFSTFAYRISTPTAGGRRFRALLHEYFEEVVVSRTIWRNLPPALVYLCRRPTVDRTDA
ncbi:class I SAM-dependent methyltransferase [Kutzneria kofuensis]|uniref:Phospholipid N-methyltransferase n=1 Tax=Kutzneria kofuensis TaxID=103725 RepID=A0A7W9KP30_9PSEU|nr:methyltransferase domain-containing protein [Kutzneria kofuensis]MBB5896035.1 phospholipid N-methyltransferase [Kutzneria kofuensis]